MQNHIYCLACKGQFGDNQNMKKKWGGTIVKVIPKMPTFREMNPENE